MALQTPASVGNITGIASPTSTVSSGYDYFSAVSISRSGSLLSRSSSYDQVVRSPESTFARGEVFSEDDDDDDDEIVWDVSSPEGTDSQASLGSGPDDFILVTDNDFGERRREECPEVMALSRPLGHLSLSHTTAPSRLWSDDVPTHSNGDAVPTVTSTPTTHVAPSSRSESPVQSASQAGGGGEETARRIHGSAWKRRNRRKKAAAAAAAVATTAANSASVDVAASDAGVRGHKSSGRSSQERARTHPTAKSPPPKGQRRQPHHHARSASTPDARYSHSSAPSSEPHRRPASVAAMTSKSNGHAERKKPQSSSPPVNTTSGRNQEKIISQSMNARQVDSSRRKERGTVIEQPIERNTSSTKDKPLDAVTLSPGLGGFPVVDDMSEYGDSIRDRDNLVAVAYEEAVKFMDNFILNPQYYTSKISQLTFLQALILELGLLDSSCPVDMPSTLTSARTLLKSQAFVNISDYLAVREQGLPAIQGVMRRSKGELIRELRKPKRSTRGEVGGRAKLRWVKETGLTVLLVDCYNRDRT